MADVRIEEVVQRVLREESVPDLIAAAAVVANTIRIGAGAMIVGSLLEAELREALCLKAGEMVTVGKPSSANGEPK